MTKLQQWVAALILAMLIVLVAMNMKAQQFGGPVIESKPLSANGQKELKGYQARYQLLMLQMQALTDDINGLQKEELAGAKLEAKDGWGLNWQAGELERHAVATPSTPPPPAKDAPKAPPKN